MNKYSITYLGPYNSKEPFVLNYIKRYSNDHLPLNSAPRCAETNIQKNTDYHLLFSSNDYLLTETPEETYKLPENSFLIYTPRGIQKYIQAIDSSYVHCIFSGNFAGEFINQLRLELNTVYLLRPQYVSVTDILYFNKQLEYIASEFRSKDLFYEQKITGMFMELLASMARQIHSSGISSEEPMQNVIKHIKNHIREPLEISELIAISNLSRSRFYCAFKNYTGVSPITFMRNYRLNISKDYLSIYPKMPLTEVSSMVGFSDSLYFSKLFKRQFGISPSQYRKKNSKK